MSEQKDPLVQSRRQQISLWLGASSLIAAGIYMTHINYMNTEWLSRAGCAVVMLGLWSGLGVIVQEQLILSRIKWQRRNAMIRAKARFAEKELSQEEIGQETDEINQAFDKQADDLTQKLKFSLGVLEVSLLITGTFLWGFGDLLM